MVADNKKRKSKEVKEKYFNDKDYKEIVELIQNCRKMDKGLIIISDGKGLRVLMSSMKGIEVTAVLLGMIKGKDGASRLIKSSMELALCVNAYDEKE